MANNPPSIVLRAPHDSEHPFSILSNVILEDERLKPVDRNVMWVLLSKPDGWVFDVGRVAKQVGIGERTLRSSLLRLEALGYVKRERLERIEGRFSAYQWLIVENP